MAPTKLTTMANKLTLVLTHATLELTLISLLLLNSLFSFLILKFALYFRLKPPCLFCSRLDHLFNSQTPKSIYSNIICDHHASEISHLGYCRNHRRIVESRDLCEGCCERSDLVDDCLSLSFVEWVKEIGIVRVDGEVGLRCCSCCGGLIKGRALCTDGVVIEDFLGCVQKRDLITEGRGLEEKSDPKTRGLLINQGDFDHGSEDCKGEEMGCVQKGDLITGSGVLVDVDLEEKLVRKTRDLVINQGEFDHGSGDCKGQWMGSSDPRKSGDFSILLSDFGYRIVDADELEREDVDLDEELGRKSRDLVNNQGEFDHGTEDCKVEEMGCSDTRKVEVSGGEFEFMFSDFGYQIVDADELEREDVGLEAEKEPLLKEENPTTVMKISCSDDLVSQDNPRKEDSSSEIQPQHLEFYIDHDDYRLIPVESVNRNVSESEGKREHFAGKGAVLGLEETCAKVESISGSGEVLFTCDVKEEPDGKIEMFPSSNGEGESKIEDLAIYLGAQDSDIKEEKDDEIEMFPSSNGEGESKIEESPVDSQPQEEIKDENLPNSHSLEDHKEDIKRECDDLLGGTQSTDVPSASTCADETEAPALTEPDTCDLPASETTFHVRSTEVENGLKPTDSIQVEESSIPCEQEGPAATEDEACEASATSACSLPNDNNDDDVQTEVKTEKCEGISAEVNDGCASPEHNEGEEERIPGTPTSVESLNHLHKKLLPLGRRESATEESLDGSIVSDLEGGATVEKLKSALHAERKALHLLYAELEEERNAAAVAASQTMAMINRLQEEKATIQMEALQYQRMMEEQSEYDQEAWQMMNELMVKRDKEKQELEKELEIYRKKVMEYEERERVRRRIEGSRGSRSSSGTCSNEEDSDGLSIDLNHEAKEEETPGSCKENGHHGTPTDAVLSLQDSLTCFEEERMSILEQLKALEEKLFTLAEEEEGHIERMKPFDQFYEENGKDFDKSSEHSLDNAIAGENGIPHRGINGSKPKQLLPLFDATEFEVEDGEPINGDDEERKAIVLRESPITKFELEKKRLAIEEEVDHVYERLQALEADREFLKHCVGSLRKGDKGLDLLQEILYHLRDLKNVELQAMGNIHHHAAVV